MRICVIIPAHNEARFIGPLITGIKQKGIDVVVIDDGSTDHTGSLAQAAGAHVMQNLRRSGKGASLQKGFDYALKNNYDGVITMDGDGQHAVEDLEFFLKVIQASPQSIVTGDRSRTNKHMPLVRRLTNQFMSGLISLICRQDIPDTQCGFRYISSSILKQMKLECHDFEIETEVLVQASKKGFKVHSVSVQTIYRDEASKINPLRDTVRFFSYIFKEVVVKKIR